MATSHVTRQLTRSLLALGAAGGLLLLLFAAILGSVAPARADGTILRVPDDYPTIQGAIDAAQPGDEIRITGSLYEESLFVSKSITLSGGWNAVFTGTSPSYTTLDPQGLGRGITISGTDGVVEVVISVFAVLNGDATGQGGVEIGGLIERGTSLPTAAMAAASPGPAELAQAARTQLTELAAQGHLLGGQAALPDMLARLDRLTTLAEGAPALSGAAVTAAGTADCGGAIYVLGASLHLIDSLLGKDTGPNVASRTGLGAGGALCAVDIPAGGLLLEKVSIQNNTASGAGAGLGGGVFVSSTVEGAVHFRDFALFNNIAGKGGDGYGGGVYLFDAPGAVLEGGGIQYNLASAAGAHGYGGGAAIVNGPRTTMTDVEFLANSANTTWSPLGLSVAAGFGGGMSVLASDEVVMGAGVLFTKNQAALHGQGSGGGLFVRDGTGLRIDGAEFTDNWSIVYPFQFEGGQSGGGAIALQSTQDTQITATLAGNRVALYNGYCQDLYGGALFGVGLQNFQLSASTINANAGGACDSAARPVAHGAVTLVSGSRALTITGNTFAGNVAELGNFAGLGGALYVEGATDVLIHRNDFLGNTGGMGGGVGGALVMEGSTAVQIDGNRMIGNRAADAAAAEFALGGAIGINTTNDLSIVNNVLAGNAANGGAGVLLVGNPALPAGAVTFVNNTLYANTGASGVNLRQWTTPITLTNNIVVSHTLGVEVESGAAALRYTLYHANAGNSGGNGSIDESNIITGPPAFGDAANSDFHLLPTSAAIDAGDPAGVPPAPPVDIEGTPRPFGPRVDIGAYEWHGPQLFLPMIAKTAPVRVGWAVGDDAIGVPAIVHTTDGGLNWTRQVVAAAIPGLDAGDISAVDEQTAWAAFVGNPGVTFPYVLHTTDGGATWFTQMLPAGVTGGVKSIKGVSRTEAWAATLDGVILHTTDGGAAWTSIPHPGVAITQVNRMDVILPHIWIADSDTKGAIIHSLDGGATWRREVITDAGATEGPLTVHAVSPDVVWASGTKSLSFFRTVNGGATWEKVITVGGFDHLDDICASSVADVWGAQNGDGVNGHIHRVDAPVGGAVEHVVATAPAVQGYTPGGVSCVDSRTAWVVAPKGVPPDPAKARGVIVFTSDGETWTQGTAPADIRYWKISMVGARR